MSYYRLHGLLKVNMGQYWSDGYQGKPRRISEKYLLHCQFIHHQFYLKLLKMKNDDKRQHGDTATRPAYLFNAAITVEK
jgi:hypothetical protein